jgi:hypothetical protein
VLWVIAVLSNITVIHRIIHTWRETRKLDTAPAVTEMPSEQDGESASGRKAPSGRLREGYPSGL